ncbi:MAG: hypothetical protein HY000_40875 [Planctomycetes bacterium]|nr:hypothetical protein [Planctomycetota bacterium]
MPPFSASWPSYSADLASDPGESRNLAAQHPDLAKSLGIKPQQWNATLPVEYVKSGTSDDDQ